MTPPITYLYVPGDSIPRLERSNTWGADALIADLEDAIAPSRKDEARHNVAAWIESAHSGTEQRWVRVNAGDAGIEDLKSVWSRHLYGVCVPKASSRGDIDRIAKELDHLEGPTPATRTVIMPLIESAKGLMSLAAISEAQRVERIQIGEVDLASDLRLEPDRKQTELLFARSQIVVVSRAVGLASPVGGVHLALGDAEGLASSTRQLRRLGFGARGLIHPEQIGPVLDAFAPSARELEDAARIVAAHDRKLCSGVGVYRDDDGRMVDEAVIRASRDLIEEKGEDQ